LVLPFGAALKRPDTSVSPLQSASVQFEKAEPFVRAFSDLV
jgi:hypothetical protein